MWLLRLPNSQADESLDKAALDAINASRSVGTRPAGFPSSLAVCKLVLLSSIKCDMGR